MAVKNTCYDASVKDQQGGLGVEVPDYGPRDQCKIIMYQTYGAVVATTYMKPAQVRAFIHTLQAAFAMMGDDP